MKVLRVSLLLILIDQATKLAIKGFAVSWLGIHVPGLMMLGESHDIIGSFLRITYIENPGMAFGVTFGDETKLFFSLFSLLAGGAVLWYLYTLRNGPLLPRLALALILAGAFGNFIDRTFYGVMYGTAPLFHGSVVDFVDVDFFTMTIGRFHLDRWPVFNIADACVSVGVVIFILTGHKPHTPDTAPLPSTSTSEVSMEEPTTETTHPDHAADAH